MLSDANSIHTKRWVKSLSQRGIDIVLFSLSPNKSDWYDNLPNVKVVDTSHNAKSSLWSKLNYLTVIPRLKKLIKKENPDIVHAHYASSYGLLGALTKASIPYIVSVWGSDVYDFPNIMPCGKKILTYNLKKADHVLSTSHIMAKETRKYTDKPIAITPFGVNTNLFKPLTLPTSEEFIIGNVKTLKPVYGIDVLIKSASIVIKNNPSKRIKLEIYGEGSQKDELIQLAKTLGIEDKVEFKGFIQNDKLPEIYNSFSVAVSVSNNESFGVVAVEAMACGCPVVTSDADGFTEVVKDGETGFIVPKQDPKATAAAIQKFIDNLRLRVSMGNAGRQRVLQLYDWSNNVDTMIEEYQKVLQSGKKK